MDLCIPNPNDNVAALNWFQSRVNCNKQLWAGSVFLVCAICLLNNVYRYIGLVRDLVKHRLNSVYLKTDPFFL